MPFAKASPTNRNAAAERRMAATQNAPHAAEPNAVRTASSQRIPMQPTPQRWAAPPTGHTVGPQGNPALAPGQSIIAPQQVARRSPIDRTVRPATTPVTATNPAAAPAQLSPADRLVAQAYQWTSTAKNEADFTRIIETCRLAAKSRPSPATDRYASELASWALNRRGQLKAETDRDDEAIIDFDAAVDADPKRWRAIHNRGVLLAEGGDFESAFEDFSRTIESNPDFAKAYSNRAALFVIAGNANAALQDYTRAVELDARLAVAHRGRGRAFHLLGQLEKAIECYDATVRLVPNDAYAIASRADLLTDLGRYAEAAAAYDNAIRLDPNSSQALTGSAWLLSTCPDESMRNSGLAIERATKAVELGGEKNAVSFDTLAAAQANVGDFLTAVQTMNQAVHLATPAEREAFEHRLAMYQQAKPYRIAPMGEVVQTNYENK